MRCICWTSPFILWQVGLICSTWLRSPFRHAFDLLDLASLGQAFTASFGCSSMICTFWTSPVFSISPCVGLVGPVEPNQSSVSSLAFSAAYLLFLLLFLSLILLLGFPPFLMFPLSSCLLLSHLLQFSGCFISSMWIMEDGGMVLCCSSYIFCGHLRPTHCVKTLL